MSTKNTALQQPPQSAGSEDDLYFKDTAPSVTIAFSVDSLKKDVICKKCSMWKSEHLWDACQNPDWMA